jgi:hypothetical protein
VGRRGSGCEQRGWGLSRGEQGGTGGLLGLRLAFWGEESRFVGCTTRSDERACTTSYNAVSRAVDHWRTSFTACLSTSEVLVFVWVLAVALVVVSRGVAAGVATVVGCDVAAALEASGSERRGRGAG